MTGIGISKKSKTVTPDLHINGCRDVLCSQHALLAVHCTDRHRAAACFPCADLQTVVRKPTEHSFHLPKPTALELGGNMRPSSVLDFPLEFSCVRI